MTFHVMNCINTCQREQVKKISQYFSQAKCGVNNFWTALFSNFTRRETGKKSVSYVILESLENQQFGRPRKKG